MNDVSKKNKKYCWQKHRLQDKQKIIKKNQKKKKCNTFVL